MICKDPRFDVFQKNDFDALYDCFLAAFANYFVHFQPEKEAFRHRLFQKLNLKPELSAVIWCHEQISGFILHTLAKQDGLLTTYNGGTGLRPEIRNRGLMHQLYEDLIPKLRDAGAQRVLLEVIVQNKPAIQLYRKLGFEIQRNLLCFKGIPKASAETRFVQIKQVKDLPYINEAFWDFSPSFMDTSSQLQRHLSFETILELSYQERPVAYIIFQESLGRISQLAVSQEYRGMGFGGLLVNAAYELSGQKPISILNIPDTATDTISALQKIGLKMEIKQYELELII